MLSIQEQEDLTITYALLLGGEITKESNRTWWCSGWVGGSGYGAACKYLEHEHNLYLHTNGTLMKSLYLKE
jgi:hypothetical protein